MRHPPTQDDPNLDEPTSNNKLNRRTLLKAAGTTAGLSATSFGLPDTGSFFGILGQTQAASSPTILEDFESTNLSTDYNFDFGESGTSLVQSPVYNGSQALQIDATDARMRSTGQFSSSPPAAGDTFSYRFNAAGGATVWTVMYGVQDHDNKYYVQFDIPDNKIRLYKYKDGSGVYIDATEVTIAENQWYEIEVTWGSNGTHSVVLNDNSGTTVVTLSGTDKEWTTGGIGFSAYLASNGGSVTFDYVTTTSSTETTRGIIDNFEDGSPFNPYFFESGQSGASIVQSPTVLGNNALELAGTTTELYSTSGLDIYPSAGDTIRYSVRATGGADDTNFSYGVQDAGNRYYLNTDFANGKFRFFILENYDHSSLDGTSAVTFDEDVWYQVELTWKTDGTHEARLIHPVDGEVTTITASDSTYSNGGIGFDAYLSAGQAVYYDFLTCNLLRRIGNFESDMGGWSSPGYTSLSRVTSSTRPAAVTKHGHALEVDISGESEPVIENQTLVQRCDFSECSYLFADVLPANVEGTDSPVSFRFRYHHSDPGGVEESHEMTINQAHGGRVCWDMSSLSTTKLENPDRLELVWYPSDHPPGSGFTYNGVTCVDNLMVSSNLNRLTHAQWMQKQRDKQRANGVLVDQEVQSQSQSAQDGVYKYYDGTQVSYHVEQLPNGNLEETVDGDTFEWEVSQ